MPSDYETGFGYPAEGFLADAPALHFPPVEFRRCKFDGLDFDVTRLLATKNTNGNGGRLSAALGHREKRAANNRVPK